MQRPHSLLQFDQPIHQRDAFGRHWQAVSPASKEKTIQRTRRDSCLPPPRRKDRPRRQRLAKVLHRDPQRGSGIGVSPPPPPPTSESCLAERQACFGDDPDSDVIRRGGEPIGELHGWMPPDRHMIQRPPPTHRRASAWPVQAHPGCAQPCRRSADSASRARFKLDQAPWSSDSGRSIGRSPEFCRLAPRKECGATGDRGTIHHCAPAVRRDKRNFALTSRPGPDPSTAMAGGGKPASSSLTNVARMAVRCQPALTERSMHDSGDRVQLVAEGTQRFGIAVTTGMGRGRVQASAPVPPAPGACWPGASGSSKPGRVPEKDPAFLQPGHAQTFSAAIFSAMNSTVLRHGRRRQ